MASTEKNANTFDMTSLSAVNSGYSLMLINNSTNEGQLITMTDLATMILNEIRNQTFTAAELGQPTAATLVGAISGLNSAISTVKSIAEKATHSINLTPFGSRSFDDTEYWINGMSNGGYVDASGWVWSTEQLADGWIHVVVDATGDVGNIERSGDAVIVKKAPSVKQGELYTFLYEIRNDHSVLDKSSGNNSQINMESYEYNQFYRNTINELLEGTGNNAGYVVRLEAPDEGATYHKRFTKYADDGTHAHDNPTGLVRFAFFIGKGDYIDFELRISVYEGRYLGDYMPYVVSDVTDLKKTATPTTNGLMSASDKKKLDNMTI